MVLLMGPGRTIKFRDPKVEPIRKAKQNMRKRRTTGGGMKEDDQHIGSLRGGKEEWKSMVGRTEKGWFSKREVLGLKIGGKNGKQRGGGRGKSFGEKAGHRRRESIS